MRPPRAAVLRAEDLAAGLAGAGLLALVELGALARAPGAVYALWVVAGLYAGVGLLLGIALTVSRILAEEGRRPLTIAMGAALPIVVLFLPLGRALFQGAWASTLPGARWAPLWVPVAGVLATTLLVFAADPLRRRPHGPHGDGHRHAHRRGRAGHPEPQPAAQRVPGSAHAAAAGLAA